MVHAHPWHLRTQKQGTKSWPTWQHGVDKFPYTYDFDEDWWVTFKKKRFGWLLGSRLGGHGTSQPMFSDPSVSATASPMLTRDAQVSKHQWNPPPVPAPAHPCSYFLEGKVIVTPTGNCSVLCVYGPLGQAWPAYWGSKGWRWKAC